MDVLDMSAERPGRSAASGSGIDGTSMSRPSIRPSGDIATLWMIHSHLRQTILTRGECELQKKSIVIVLEQFQSAGSGGDWRSGEYPGQRETRHTQLFICIYLQIVAPALGLYELFHTTGQDAGICARVWGSHTLRCTEAALWTQRIPCQARDPSGSPGKDGSRRPEASN